MLCEVVKRINIVDGIDYLSNIDFHYIILSAGINSFLQLLAEMVACKHYHINASRIASLLIGLFCGLLWFLQHHYKIDSLHLINSATNSHALAALGSIYVKTGESITVSFAALRR